MREETTVGDKARNLSGLVPGSTEAESLPPIVDRDAFQANLDALRLSEKAHTREGDAIAAARRRLPMVEVDGGTELIGEAGATTLLAAFEGRRQLLTYYMMWYHGRPADEQCEGCTWNNTQTSDMSYVESRDITYAVLCQGPYEESRRYRDFMGWNMPWYSAQASLDTLLVGRAIGSMNIVCYLRDGDRVFETYWTTGRGVEAMDINYRLIDLTAWGRQEPWEDSPAGWPQGWGVKESAEPRTRYNGITRGNGRPIAQWSRLAAGRSDDLTGSP